MMPQPELISILNPREVARAQTGPRELKDPRSKGYAIQTLYHFRRVLEGLKCDQAEVQRELGQIERYEHWRVLGYPSLDAMFDAELGELSDLGKRNAAAAGLKLGKREIGIEGGTAGPGRGNKTGNNVTRFERGNASNYTLARLRRDRPDLAEQVTAGKLTANAAAIVAGFRVRTISVPLDPERAGKILRRHFTREQLTVLARSFADDE